MWKVIRKTVSRHPLHREESMDFLEDTMGSYRSVLKTIFSLAVLAGITPKQLASMFEGDTLNHFARDFQHELVRLANARARKLESKLQDIKI